ncbi:MAG: hypothetical protein QOE92_1174 [Chloroflexota bacterium]|jgi:YkoY family integral membrane protein|nr:hypothetical protein [Chloroflexota bacterium]
MASIDPVQAGAIVLTLVLLEAVLSFDNAAILAVLSRRLPAGHDRSRAITYGLMLAYLLRLAAIFGALLLMQNTIFLTLGGAYLVFLLGKHVWDVARGSPKAAPTGGETPGRRVAGLTALQVVVIQIGFVDVAFALDQVVAAVAFTKDVPAVQLVGAGAVQLTYQQALIITASTAGLVSLRLLAPAMSRLMDWLPVIEHMAFIAVGFVGALLLLEHPQVVAPPTELIDLIQPLKVPITLALFAVPVLLRLAAMAPRRMRS